MQTSDFVRRLGCCGNLEGLIHQRGAARLSVRGTCCLLVLTESIKLDSRVCFSPPSFDRSWSRGSRGGGAWDALCVVCVCVCYLYLITPLQVVLVVASELLVYVCTYICGCVWALFGVCLCVIFHRTSSQCPPGSAFWAPCVSVWRRRWPSRSLASRARRSDGSSWGSRIAPVLLVVGGREGITSQCDRYSATRAQVWHKADVIAPSLSW